MRTLNDVSLKENDRRAVERASQILRSQFPVAQVVLFGSKARGDDDAESDIDLLVLTDRLVSHAERHQMRHAIYPIQLLNDVAISLTVVPREEWETGMYSVLPIRDEVNRDGVAA